ncbi:alpha/beta fold hydrolase [Chryseosolibacter indicus]|uniref:Alpha/beta hydrolase n=1 Tax=Chryseosolibacter indicus TaxID=2782351 RepID=A0ABS5VWI8_9BACT|nr:alpha/beta hydrolase [Chryseosolibacter indicus]MBT1705792.1 alpha/beta hydrolase [Chryseosolibacter indicus]
MMIRSANIFLFVIALTRSAFAQESFFINYDYGKLYYQKYGKGEVIFLLSGGPGNDCSQLRDVAIALSKHYTVILPEQRGTGRSIPNKLDSTTINVSALTTDLKNLIDHLNVKKAKIIGHSWGAMLAMNFAALNPQRVESLYLLSPGPYNQWSKNFAVLQANISSRLGKHELETLMTLSEKRQKGTASKSDSITFRKTARLAYIYDKNKLDSLFNKIEVKQYPQMQQLMLKDMQKNFDVSASLNNYKGPIHIVCGRQDVLAFCTYELQLLRPSVKVIWINNSGHFPMYEQSTEFYAQLTSVLKD